MSIYQSLKDKRDKLSRLKFYHYYMLIVYISVVVLWVVSLIYANLNWVLHFFIATCLIILLVVTFLIYIYADKESQSIDDFMADYMIKKVRRR